MASEIRNKRRNSSEEALISEISYSAAIIQREKK